MEKIKLTHIAPIYPNSGTDYKCRLSGKALGFKIIKKVV